MSTLANHGKGLTPPDSEVYVAVQAGEPFQRLRRLVRGWVFPMTVVFLSWYLLYVIASGWARGFMSKEVVAGINVALIFGLLQFASTFLIASLYSRHMNRRVDPIADEIRREIEGAA